MKTQYPNTKAWYQVIGDLSKVSRAREQVDMAYEFLRAEAPIPPSRGKTEFP